MELLIHHWHVVVFGSEFPARNHLHSTPMCKIHTQPKVSHGNAVKRICHYLQGPKTKGMILCPSKQLTIDCFVDADFARQWNVEDQEDPQCVKLHTRYILMVGNCQVHWVSQLQSEVAISTMEAEYIALTTAMQDLIPL